MMDINIVKLNDNYLEKLVDFINIVWDKNATVHSFTEKRNSDLHENPYGAEGGFPIFLLLGNDQVVGNIDATPCKLWANEKEYHMYWISGLHILPECRGKGVAKLLPEKVMEELPIVTGYFVLEAPYKIYKKLGWNILGKIPEYIKIVNPREFVYNLRCKELDSIPKYITAVFSNKGSLFTAIIRSGIFLYKELFDLVSSSNAYSGKCRNVNEYDSRVDDLWERNKSKIKLAQVRKAKYLNWKFKAEEGWIKIVCEEKDAIDGYVILSCKQFKEDKRLGSMKVISIIDILWDFDKPYVFESIINHVEKIGHSQNIHVITYSINHSDARRMLLRKGYIKIPSTVYFQYYSKNKDVNLSNDMNDWYITRGDADAAGSLAPNE